jgi:hypothetical protein
MKNTNVFKLFWIIAFVAIIGFSMAGCDIPEDLSLDELVGVWEGSYGPNQGETGLTLTVYEEGNKYKAKFEFYNLPGRSNSQEGSYYMNVSSDRSKYILKGYEWIKRPSIYNFVDLEGTINGNVFSGSLTGTAGSQKFRVVKK